MGRKWKIVLLSASISGLDAAVLSGCAVSVVAKSAVVPGMRVLSEAESFPTLPSVDLVLYRSGTSNNAAADAMGDLVTEHLARSSIAPVTKPLKTQAGSGALSGYSV